MRVAFVRSFTPEYDGRLKKYLAALRENKAESIFIGWDRSGRQQEPAGGTFLFKRPGKLGEGWRNGVGLLLWNFYIIKTLWHCRRDLDVIHAIDLDSAVSAWIFAKIRRVPIVFDIYDHYAQTRNIRGLVGLALSAVERFIAKFSSVTLLADESRFRQHGLSQNMVNIQVIENVPHVIWKPSPISLEKGERIRIGYFGVFEKKHRGLETLIDGLDGDDRVELHFAGYGALESYISYRASRSSNIFYHGVMQHEKGVRFLEGMHCITGFYYLTVPNHAYAAPNKYYEHLLLGRPLLTTRGTPPGDKVSVRKTGWALEEGVQPLRDWLAGLDIDDVKLRANNARMVWDEYYKDYYSIKVERGYPELLRRVIKDEKY